MDKKPMGKRKNWIWILCAALVVCIAIVCIILFTGKDSITGKKDSTAKNPSQEITTDAGDSKDKPDVNAQQNGGTSSGVGNNSIDQPDGASDIDLPYVEIPVEQDPGNISSGASGGGAPSGQSSGDAGSDGNVPGGDSGQGSETGDSGSGSASTAGEGNGDIILPMVP